MKIKDIITLGNSGFLAATGHSLPVEHFYKFVKFKRAVQKAYDAASKAQKDFRTEAGMAPEDLLPGAKPDAEKMARYDALNEPYVEEEADMPEVRIPIECYKGLYDENQKEVGGRRYDIFANMAVEELILNNLFTEENDND